MLMIELAEEFENERKEFRRKERKDMDVCKQKIDVLKSEIKEREDMILDL